MRVQIDLQVAVQVHALTCHLCPHLQAKPAAGHGQPAPVQTHALQLGQGQKTLYRGVTRFRALAYQLACHRKRQLGGRRKQ
ncbi:hypothetical protein D3C85_1749720 [compost metagenome]